MLDRSAAPRVGRRRFVLGAALTSRGGACTAAIAADLSVDDVRALLASHAGAVAPDLQSRLTASIFGRRFQRANLTGANLKKANPAGADLQRGHRSAILRGANLRNAKLRNAKAFSTILADAT
jgi:uncharacterized protein YjbI with pentapeptide repeats